MQVSLAGDTDACIDLVTKRPAESATGARTADWEYISLVYGKDDKQGMAALMPTQAALTKALQKWTQTMFPLASVNVATERRLSIAFCFTDTDY